MNKILRVHSDIGTVDVPIEGKSPKADKIEAQYLLREGFWIENKLYPASRIVFIEVLK